MHEGDDCAEYCRIVINTFAWTDFQNYCLHAVQHAQLLNNCMYSVPRQCKTIIAAAAYGAQNNRKAATRDLASTSII
eukprot:4028182-Pleurochrysis_carterae.AAC.1